MDSMNSPFINGVSSLLNQMTVFKYWRRGLPWRFSGYDFAFQCKGVWVCSLVGEPRSHMLPGQKNQNIRQKQYCNKLNKDF